MKIKIAFVSRVLAVLAGAFLLTLPAAAQYYGQQRGETSASLSLATARQFDRDYTVLAGRYGRYFVDEFEATIGLEVWQANDPVIYKIIPELRYVSGSGQTFKPYVALFLTRTFYSSTVSSHGSFGFRAGMYYVLNPRAYLGVGFVNERLDSCDRNVLKDCEYFYPELTLAFRF